MTKSWVADIERHIDYWTRRLSGYRSWWPRYVYHYTDINNAANILNFGRLLSRNALEEGEEGFVDGACAEVICQTLKAHRRFVRFYYRPRTPTQYRNEGIRPPEDRWKGAHCPVPVFFLFDALQLMGRDDAQYSTGNMGSPHVPYGPNLTDFQAIPFDKVFHDGRFDPEATPEITFHRNAELLIPDAVSLDGLKVIACRSPAERSSLLHLVTPATRDLWGKAIRVGNSSIFERKWAFVSQVTVGEGEFVFEFNPNSGCSRNLKSRVVITRPDGSTNEIENCLNHRGRYAIGLKKDYPYLDVMLFLEDSLAYTNRLIFSDLL